MTVHEFILTAFFFGLFDELFQSGQFRIRKLSVIIFEAERRTVSADFLGK
jgi:hypothetical protein